MSTLTIPGSVELLNLGNPIHTNPRRPNAAHADIRAKVREQRTRKVLGIAATVIGWLGLVILYLAILAGMKPSRLAIDFGVCIVLTQLGRVLSRTASKTTDGPALENRADDSRKPACPHFV